MKVCIYHILGSADMDGINGDRLERPLTERSATVKSATRMGHCLEGPLVFRNVLQGSPPGKPSSED
jgi:hypothetical protein